ncbi:protein-glutamate O-methyltransferase CheR [Anaeromyxobacter sp. PSR-1]|uniref:CheR family methyltransferase n=1 Tax=unclassified Anaeromyxobacter TaxID=2620896 RepID=UPI0005DF8D72|nr:CheR family methyltransferase [Anaeromyxobacter sp. PSR-1]GAO05152.1 chemotaxis protein methyltransferase [Anaeromyxobacter sp. PSR-1]
MDAETYQGFQRIAHERAGIFLRPGKAALVEARLARRLRELALSTEREYLEHLQAEGGDELVRFLDAISTNFTHFFREADHFEALVQSVRVARRVGQRRFRVWCAGCSSGEEPYTAAMVLEPELDGCDWRILATDLSTRVLARAAEATYADEEVAAIPAALRARFLAARPGPGGSTLHEVVPRLRERVVLRRLNLAEHPYPMRGPLDAIFCRNVMIYFDRPMRARLVEELERLLRPGAPLFVGHSETLAGIPTRLRSERPSVYRMPEAT